MKLFDAGNLDPTREKLFLSSVENRLISFHWYYYDNTYKLSLETLMQKHDEQIDIFLDSGAFSAWSKGATINIQEYITFIKENQEHITTYANLDVIGDSKASWENQKIMEDSGLKPLPVFHLGDTFDFLERCLEYDYFCLGGMAGQGLGAVARLNFLDSCWKIICDKKGMPKSKVHGFGMTSFRLLRRYPWYSVDSTSWIVTSRMGSIYIPPKIDGEWSYDKDPWKICISEKSPSVKDAGQHMDNLPENIKAIFTEYLEMKGFSLEELAKEYIKRDLVNLEYFKDFEKAQPKWPWAWKPKTGMRSFL